MVVRGQCQRRGKVVYYFSILLKGRFSLFDTPTYRESSLI